jgi:hypothetical protein
MLVAGDLTEQRHELERVLASGIFDRAPSLAQVLAYVCEKYFDGTSGEIKEYNIALDALGRSPEFDQKKDSIVRVQVHRLRERLAEYYEKDGADHPIHIVIPQGQYVPSFIVREIPHAAPPPVHEPEVEKAPAPPVAPHPVDVPTSRRPILWAAIGAVAIAGIVTLALVGREKSAPAPERAVPSAVSPSATVRIGVGQDMPFTDGFGHLWEADRDFSGGTVVKTPDRLIRGTREPRLYQARRQGSFGYDIALEQGVYELRLHFAEVHFGENGLAGLGGEASRAFGVLVNGKTMINRLDVIGEAGASTAHVKVFKDISPDSDGKLHLSFTPLQSIPFLNAIEITPGSPGKLTPIRMVMQDREYTDPQGRRWLPDRLAIGGQVVKRAPLASAPDPDLYAGERFGNLQYFIPVPPGKYTLNLYMAERWHGPDLPAGGGVGSRVFDIHVNGLLLARDVDVFKRAGGANHPLVLNFHGLEPNHQGYLALSFVPTKTWPLINALEVLDESK